MAGIGFIPLELKPNFKCIKKVCENKDFCNVIMLSENIKKYFGKVIFSTLAYLELKQYSEPWYIKNQCHIQNFVKHLP